MYFSYIFIRDFYFTEKKYFFGHATNRETVTLIASILRGQVVTIEGEAAGIGSRVGGRGPEEASAGDIGGLTREELEKAGERNRKWGSS